MIDDKHKAKPVGSAIVAPSCDRSVIFVDADNTLWDTDKVFADAQLELLHDVEDACTTRAETSNRLDFIRSIDQELAARHHLDLRYPPRLLILTLSLMLKGVLLKDAAKNAWIGVKDNSTFSNQVVEAIEKRYFENLDKTPSLLSGVKSGLAELRIKGARILILTEGHKERVSRTAHSLGIMQFVDRVIEAKKNRRLFERVLRLVGNPEIAVMVGDQVTKDIVPASLAGLRTIYIPGGFKPKWEEAVTKNIISLQVEKFSDVPKIIANFHRENEMNEVPLDL